MIAAEAVWALRRAAGRGPVSGVLHDRGRWCLVDRNGAAHPARLCPDSYVHPQLVILNFVLARGRRRAVVLLPDSVPADQLRCLRIILLTAASS